MSQSKKPRNADHVRRKNAPSPSNEVIEERLKPLLSPAILGQQGYARVLGVRNRILSFPVMATAVPVLLWRQVPGVCELTRVLAREECLWAPKLEVSQQALSQRFLSFPAQLFEQLLKALLPQLRQRGVQRQRPLPGSVAHARVHFSRVLAADGSTLEALFRKLKALQELAPGTLAGKMCTVIDLTTRLPEYLWFNEAPQAHDTQFLDRILCVTRAGTLWILDRGFYDFRFFEHVIGRQGAWITRTKSNLVYRVTQVIAANDWVRDQRVCINGCRHPMRLVEVRFGSRWYSYLTSVMDPAGLPAPVAADLYR